MPSGSRRLRTPASYYRSIKFNLARRKIRTLMTAQKLDESLKHAMPDVLRGNRRRTILKKRYASELSKPGDRFRDHHVSGLLDSSPGRRAEALKQVGRNVLLSTQPIVTELLKDEDAIVRSRAVLVLTLFEHTSALSPGTSRYNKRFFQKSTRLIRARLVDSDPGVRCSALVSVGMMFDTSSLNTVRKLTKDENVGVRQLAQIVLASIDRSLESTRAGTINRLQAHLQLQEIYEGLIYGLTGQRMH